MDLKSYFSTPGAMSVAQLREAMVRLGSRVKSDAQIRQWQHKYRNRQPDPANARIIERATGGVVTCRELRPDDHHLIWDEPKVDRPPRVEDTSAAALQGT